MAKIILDLTIENPKLYDVVYYNGKGFATIHKTAFLKELTESVNNLSLALETLVKRIENIEKQLAYDHGEIEEDGMVE